MGDFRSFKTARREPAAPMKPLIDPAGWTADGPQGRLALELPDQRRRRRRARSRGRGRAPQRRRHGRHPQGGFPAQGLRRRAHRRAPRADGRPRHRDDAGFPARPLRPRGHRHRLYRARRPSRADDVAEQARSHPRPREGPRRRLQRRQHPRLHDQCRDALPHRRLRLCRPALPADADVGRREPDRELGDGLQHDAATQARAGRGAVRRLLPLAQRRGQPRRSAVFQAADLLVP